MRQTILLFVFIILIYNLVLANDTAFYVNRNKTTSFNNPGNAIMDSKKIRTFNVLKVDTNERFNRLQKEITVNKKMFSEYLVGQAKFNNVAAVLLVMFIGLIVFMFILNNRVNKLNKNKD